MNNKRIKNLSKCQETMIIQQETYEGICTIKIIIKSMVLIHQDKEIQVFFNKLIS